MRRIILLLVTLTVLASGANAAWWDTDWAYNQVVTLKTSEYLSANITDDEIILVDFNSVQTVFWANVKSDGSDVRFISADGLTILSHYFQEFSATDQNMLAWVRVEDTFPSASNVDFNVYFGNAAAVDSQDSDAVLIDVNALFHSDDNTGTNVSDELGVYDLTASNALIWGASFRGDSSLYFNALYNATQGKMLDDYNLNTVIDLWFRPDTTWQAGVAQQFLMRKVNTGAPDSFSIETINANGTLNIKNSVGGVPIFNFFTITNNWPANVWHKLTVVMGDENGAAVYVNGIFETGDELATGVPNFGTNTDFFLASDTDGTLKMDGSIDELKIFEAHLSADEVTLLYQADVLGLQEYGAATIIPNQPPELVMTTVNGEEFSSFPKFVFSIDGNISVDFNVFDVDNNRLTVDLNFGSPLQGEGTVIVKDLNLTESVCPDQDWGDIPSACSWDFNYFGVSDGNFALTGLLSDNALTDFNASDGNFAIISDVNLVVLVPINEETGVVIDTIISSFIVRINANGILSTFSNMVDLNGFLIPLSPNVVLVEIDTNTPLLFDSRTYSFSFTESVDRVTLQPFLPPVPSSILTTINVVEFENLNPIPGVRLQVFKILATGRTLIHDSITDGKGQSSVPFIVADLYEIDVLIDGVVIFSEQYIATATTAEHFIFIPGDEIVVIPPDYSVPTVSFIPSQTNFNTVDVNLGVIVSTTLSNISSIHFFITNNDFNIWDGGVDTAAPSDGNTYSVNINDINPALIDTNFPFISTVIVVIDDGNSFRFSASYSLRPGERDILNILMYNFRTDWGCNADDLSITCEPLMFIAFFVILFLLCAFAAGARGLVGGAGLSLIGLILTMFFVVISWIPMWIGLVMVFAAIGVILTRTRFIGA